MVLFVLNIASAYYLNSLFGRTVQKLVVHSYEGRFYAGQITIRITCQYDFYYIPSYEIQENINTIICIFEKVIFSLVKKAYILYFH